MDKEYDMPRQLNMVLTPPKPASGAQDESRKNKLVEARNERRRIKYAQDREYRESARAASRKTYETTEGRDLSGDVQHVEKNLAQLTQLATVRPVFVEKTAIGERACLTEPELADAIGRHHQVFQRMISDGRFPKSVFSTRSHKSKAGVFLLEEARALMTVYLDHVRTSLHYYHSHTETKERLVAVLASARKEIGADKWISMLNQ